MSKAPVIRSVLTDEAISPDDRLPPQRADRRQVDILVNHRWHHHHAGDGAAIPGHDAGGLCLKCPKRCQCGDTDGHDDGQGHRLAPMHYDADRSSNVHLSQGSLRTPTGGDHETITQGYVRLIRHFLATTDRHRPFAAISAGLIATYGGKQTLLSHYSPEHLTSWAARTG